MPDYTYELEAINHAKLVGDHIHALIDSGKYDFHYLTKEHYKDGPNPYYLQTRTGLFIEETFSGHPAYLYTPLGKWSILGSTYTEPNQAKNIKIMDTLKDDLSLVLVRPAKRGVYEDFGAIWEINKFNTIPFQKAVFKERDEFLSYDVCKKLFKQFTDNNPI